jgi:voltage-gated potassium channel Kch
MFAKKGVKTVLPLSGKNVLVLGGGKFGTNALRYLKQNGTRVLVVDIDPECVAGHEADVLATDSGALFCLRNGESALVVADAIEVLGNMLDLGSVPDLVFTAIPGNVVAKLAVLILGKRGFEVKAYSNGVPEVLDNVPKSLVSFVDKDAGFVVASYMLPDERCRENCLPPHGVCAVTGRPKLAPMNLVLEFGV